MKPTKISAADKSEAHRVIERLVREDRGKLLSYLIANMGDIQLAEDSLQDSLESALLHWHRNGIPHSPAGWLLQAARRKAIDRMRRVANFSLKQEEYRHLLEIERGEEESEALQDIPDERLKLIFTCCHPALETKSRIALTLRTLGGLRTGEIARAFLDSEDAMAQRIVRAKRKIKIAAIPYKVPEADQWDERLSTVLGVLYLIFNEGYFSQIADNQMRLELSNEAIRLTGILMRLRPGESEVEGLLALMLLHDSRRDARIDRHGDMVALDEQDRQCWDSGKIREGIGYLNLALSRKKPGPYQIQAAISAIHSRAPTSADTDWDEIVLLYDELYKYQPNPVVALNKCVALSFSRSPEDALDMLEEIAGSLQNYQPYHAAKADLYRRCKRYYEAEKSYLRAIELSDEPMTRTFLERKMGAMLRTHS